MSAAEVGRPPIHQNPDTFSGDGDGRATVVSNISTSFSVDSNYTERYSTLSRLSRASVKLRTTSSFPSILNLYEPIQEEGPRQKPPFTDRGPPRQKEKKPRRFAKSKEWGEHLETRYKSEMTVIDRLSRSNRTIRIEAVAREQMEKYDKYMKDLNSKVERQREQQKKRDEDFEIRLKQLEEEGRKKHKIKKRPKEDVVPNNEFIRKLPKSNLSRMVRLSDDLQKKGVLKTPLDVDKFWKEYGRKSIDGVDIFKRDPLTEVPDTRQWMGKKSTLASLDDKARKKKLKKLYSSQEHDVIPPIPNRKSRQRKAKSSEEFQSKKTSAETKDGIYSDSQMSGKHSDFTSPSVT